ncbi:MAG: cupredoxin domain-containing protein [Solirubrobacteraceae bacterium]
MSLRPALALAIAAAALVAAPVAQAKKPRSTTVRTPQGTITTTPLPGTGGARKMLFRFGPVRIHPGQNTIAISPVSLHPPTGGWITSFHPNLTYANGKVPPVDVIHLHHAVWLVSRPGDRFRLTWAAGEEKTIVRVPHGFGWRYGTGDQWLLNHMIHNLYPTPTRVYITWEVTFIPDGTPAARGMREVKTQWLDVVGGKAYPVFDVLQGSGQGGRFTFPNDSPNPYPDGIRRNQWVVDHDGTLVGTAGHLHPGGLWTDLKLTRAGRSVELFRSRAHYWEPAGAVSWDVAMTATPKTWRVAVKKGDVLSVSGTYDSARASWYESMAIMPVAMTTRPAGGADPFVTNVAVAGKVTHGHLPENNHHGGEPGSLRNATKLPNGPAESTISIKDFLFKQGDLSVPGAGGLPPVVAAGQPLTFVNDDAGRNIFHTITACRQPCNGAAGIAFPLANAGTGPLGFDSGELGFGPYGFTAASNRKSWQTPADLGAGTYTFFCRIHPFMRGSFRVTG